MPSYVILLIFSLLVTEICLLYSGAPARQRGPVDSYSKHTSAMLTMVENNEVTASLRRFWELESIGITEAVNPAMSQEEELAVNDFNDGLNFDGKNYEVRLP